MFGLSEVFLDKLKEQFKKKSSIEKVILYGSRAKGTFKKGSDIDICLWGKELNLQILYDLEEEIEKLNSPYFFDISIFSFIKDKTLREHILRVGKVLYQKE